VTYAMAINVFFVLMEIFTAAYSDIPEHVLHFEYLFFGLGGNTRLVPWMWSSEVLAVIALVLLINPGTRRRDSTLLLACIAIFGSIWIDKGLGMIVTGFVPNPLGRVVDYWPTFTEVMIGIGVYAVGALLVTIFYRIALAVKEEALT
jgi:Ni/Fe-hydrogenase subunit HybB-like protein